MYALGIWNESYMSRGIGVETTMLVLGYAFDVLKLHRVGLKVLDYNERAINCYQKCGFKQEGILRDSAYIEGAFHSDIIMSILEDEYYSK
jgi:RimJ/RimL family protein N-acetyltransferase